MPMNGKTVTLSVHFTLDIEIPATVSNTEAEKIVGETLKEHQDMSAFMYQYTRDMHGNLIDAKFHVMKEHEYKALRQSHPIMP